MAKWNNSINSRCLELLQKSGRRLIIPPLCKKVGDALRTIPGYGFDTHRPVPSADVTTWFIIKIDKLTMGTLHTDLTPRPFDQADFFRNILRTHHGFSLQENLGSLGLTETPSGISPVSKICFLMEVLSTDTVIFSLTKRPS